MRLKPNDLPPMEVGEIRFITFKLSGATGVNAINSFEIESPNLTFGTPAISGSSVTVRATFGQAGTHAIKATANLASNEKLIGIVRAKVMDSTQCVQSSDGYR